MVIHFYILDSESAWKGITKCEEVIFVPNMNIFDFKLDTSKKSRQQSHNWRYFKFSSFFWFCLSLLFSSVCHGIPLSFKVFSLPLLEQILTNFCTSLFPFLLFFSLFLLLSLYFWLPKLIYKLMHHDYICDLVINIIETAFSIIWEVCICWHFISIGP